MLWCSTSSSRSTLLVCLPTSNAFSVNVSQVVLALTAHTESDDEYDSRRPHKEPMTTATNPLLSGYNHTLCTGNRMPVRVATPGIHLERLQGTSRAGCTQGKGRSLNPRGTISGFGVRKAHSVESGSNSNELDYHKTVKTIRQRNGSRGDDDNSDLGEPEDLERVETGAGWEWDRDEAVEPRVEQSADDSRSMETDETEDEDADEGDKGGEDEDESMDDGDEGDEDKSMDDNEQIEGKKGKRNGPSTRHGELELLPTAKQQKYTEYIINQNVQRVVPPNTKISSENSLCGVAQNPKDLPM